MGIPAIQGFSQLSNKKKAAIITTGAVGVALVATAAVLGRKSDAFVKAKKANEKFNVFKTLGEGFKAIGNAIKTKFESIKNSFSKNKNKVAEKAPEAAKAE